jgi:hypothetical protein
MDAHRNETSLADVAAELGALSVGAGVLAVPFLPLAIPALLFGLLLAVPLGVLAIPVVAIWLLVRGVARLLGRRRPAPREVVRNSPDTRAAAA